jgi:hypothetical protein
MKPKIPGPQFEDHEADRLIAAFGAPPTPEKRQDLHALLKGQKEQFLKQERQRTRQQGRERE